VKENPKRNTYGQRAGGYIECL